MNTNAYQIDTPENRQFLEDQVQTLLDFGHRFPSPGGGSYWLDADGAPCTERNRETWITSRMIHVYSLGTLLGHPGSEELVDAGLKGLTGELRDAEHGGWYAGVSADGVPYGPKQCYAHAFVMLAASSAMLAGRPGAEQLLQEAEAVFDQYYWDEEIGLSVDTWDIAFQTLDSYRGLNANMHTVEAFLAIADASGDAKYRVRAGRIIDHVIKWASCNDWRIPEHYRSDWSTDLSCSEDRKDDPFKPYGATPGHGIEWARLITQWALSVYGGKDRDDAEPTLRRYIRSAESLYRQAVQDAWNADGGPGIVYTTDWDGNPVVHDRMHWTLAEAINTSAVLYHVTEKAEYAQDYAQFLQYLDETVADHENGSWYHQLDARGNVMDTVWPGKCDLYHALQSMLIPRCRPVRSIAAAVKGQEYL